LPRGALDGRLLFVLIPHLQPEQRLVSLQPAPGKRIRIDGHARQYALAPAGPDLGAWIGAPEPCLPAAGEAAVRGADLAGVHFLEAAEMDPLGRAPTAQGEGGALPRRMPEREGIGYRRVVLVPADLVDRQSAFLERLQDLTDRMPGRSGQG